MSTLGRTRLRLAADAASFDAPLDVLRRATPQFWRGNDVQFEIAMFFNGALLDVSNLASLTLEIRPLGANGQAPDPSFAPLMGATVTAFDNTTTLDNWNAGTNQHAVVIFTAAQSNISAGAAWLSIFAITNDSPGRVITLCAGPVRVLEDGAGLATTPTPTADTFYTAAESDARFAAIGAGGEGGAPASNSNPLMDGAAAPGTATAYTRADHVHPSDTSRAPLASPALTGTPTAPTVGSAGDSSTKIATTAFVQAAIAAAGGGGGGCGSGTVTSVALSVPGFLTVSGSPITSAGTLALALANQTANTHFAGPASGSAAAPTFRALVAADLPSSVALPGTPTVGTPPGGSDSSAAIATTAWVRSYTAPITNDGSGHYLFGGGSYYDYPGPIKATVTINGAFACQSTFETAFVNNTTTGTTDTPWNVNTISLQTTDPNRDTAIRFICDDNTEDGAVGIGNSGNPAPWGGYTFMSTSPGYNLTTGVPARTLPGGLALIWEGTFEGRSNNFFRRFEIGPDTGVTFRNAPSISSDGTHGDPQMSLTKCQSVGNTYLSIYNYNTDVNAAAGVTLYNNTGMVGNLNAFGSNYNYHSLPQNGLALSSYGAGGLMLIAGASGGTLTFRTGGDNSANYAGGISSVGKWVLSSTGTGSDSAGAHALLTSAGEVNVAYFCNQNIAGYSAIFGNDYNGDNHNRWSLGYGNPSASAPFAGANYIESISYTTGVLAPDFFISFTNEPDAHFYKRFWLDGGNSQVHFQTGASNLDCMVLGGTDAAHQNYAQINAPSGASNVLSLCAQDSSFSYHAFPASGAAMLSTGAGGLMIAATNATGIIKFLTGGDQNANEWLRIDASGNFIASNVVTSAPSASLNNSQYQFCVYDNSGTAVFEVLYKNASGTVKVGTLALS